MSTTNDGGPAFPHSVPPGVIGAGCGPHVEWGMTLRDYFAAAALTGLVSNRQNPYAPVAASEAYKYADAMIAERSKP